MEWYYAKESKQSGPHTESEFEALVAAGDIQDTTMVWNSTMADWQTYGAIFGKTEISAMPTQLDSQISPRRDVWTEGRNLVFFKEATLPCRCVKCNKPVSDGELVTKKLSYNHPWVYILLLVNLLIMLIVAACTAKRAVVEVPICEFHRARIKSGVIMSWLLCLGGLTLVIVGIGMPSAVIGWAGFASLVAGIIVGMTRGRSVYASKIDEDQVWMRGVCPSYLEEL